MTGGDLHSSSRRPTVIKRSPALVHKVDPAQGQSSTSYRSQETAGDRRRERYRTLEPARTQHSRGAHPKQGKQSVAERDVPRHCAHLNRGQPAASLTPQCRPRSRRSQDHQSRHRCRDGPSECSDEPYPDTSGHPLCAPENRYLAESNGGHRWKFAAHSARPAGWYLVSIDDGIALSPVSNSARPA